MQLQVRLALFIVVTLQAASALRAQNTNQLSGERLSDSVFDRLSTRPEIWQPNESHFVARSFNIPQPLATIESWDQPSVPIVYVQDGETSEGGSSGGSDLAAQSQNPVSSLVSLPLQNNWDFGFGPDERRRYVGNLQPVVPIKLNDHWNLINRVIIPFVNVPVGPDENIHGMGDMIGQFYFSPRNSGSFIWGVGPAVLFPTASDPVLGFGEWGAGVNGVALISKGPIVTGALVYQIWGNDGITEPFLVQPFFNYNLQRGWFVNVSGEANADWALPEEDRWSFPFGGGVGRVFPIFGQPINVSARFAPYLISPTDGPEWQFRLAVTLLFPK